MRWFNLIVGSRGRQQEGNTILWISNSAANMLQTVADLSAVKTQLPGSNWSCIDISVRVGAQ